MKPESRVAIAEVLTNARPYALVESDAIEALSSFPAASVDLIFADPPYNLSNGGTTCKGGKRVVVDKAAWDDSRGLIGDHAFHLRWLAAAQRVLKPSGTIWVSGTHHAIFSLGWAMQILGFHFLNTITWYKTNAAPNLACRMLTHSTELLIWAAPYRTEPLAHHFGYSDLKAENGGKQLRDVWSIPDDAAGAVLSIPAAGKAEKGEDGHPTQKPEALLDRVIRAASKPGDLVVDPFNGSGTTGFTALRLDRRYIGIDLDKEYLAATATRLQGPRRRHG